MAIENKINKKINIVYATTDYSQFKLSELNREVKEKSISKLMVSVSKTGQRQPILVDKNFCVFDGQHRLEVCKRLGIPVKFIVDEYVEEESIQQLNANQKAWTLINHIEFFAKKGNENYIKLLELKQNSPINISMLAALLMNKKGGGNISELVKSGDFKMKNYSIIKLFLEELKQLRKVCPTGMKTVDAFVYACWELWKTEKFEVERFLSKNKNLPDQARGVRDSNVMLAYILENYNKGFKDNSENKVNFFYDDKKNVIITDYDRKFTNVKS